MATNLKFKQQQLDLIAEEIENCKLCKKNTIGKAVPGEGNADADIIFIGEAPGKNEAETGKPFIGRAGKLLRAGIASLGIKDEEVFITSPVKRLPKHITPTFAEIEHGKKHLLKQFNIIDPKIVVLLGRVGALAMLGKNLQMTKEHGKILNGEDGRLYFLMLHPAAPLHSPKLRVELDSDFKKLKALLNKHAKVRIQKTSTKKEKL
ncbi:MAG: uracil-DNA glycosylase [Candidatus Doudnabacteria bacterium]